MIKKHLSVLMLFTRSTLNKFLLIVFVMTAAQSALFAFTFQSLSGSGRFGLDTLLDAVSPQVICAVCFLMLCALMCLTGCEFGSKQSYTLSRLRISEKKVFLWQAVNNAGLLLLFLAAQISIIFVFCGIYTAHYPQPQAAVLVFYANDFLHNLFPLAETSRHFFNVILLLSLAITSACFPARLRRGEKPVSFFVVVLIGVLSFTRSKGNIGLDVWLSIVNILFSIVSTLNVWKEASDEKIS